MVNFILKYINYTYLRLDQDEVRHRTRISNSTLCTGSSFSLSSGPTSGYNSGNNTQLQQSNGSLLTGQVCTAPLQTAGGVWSSNSHAVASAAQRFPGRRAEGQDATPRLCSGCEDTWSLAVGSRWGLGCRYVLNKSLPHLTSHLRVGRHPSRASCHDL